MNKNPCALCDWIAGEPPGGWLLEGPHFVLGIAPDFEVPGWYFLAMRRHGEGPMSMNPEEAAAYGPLLVQVTQAVRDVMGAERVYVVAYGELYPHWHCLISARTPDVLAELRGPAFFANRGQLIDLDKSIEIAAKVRQAL